jgi:hypothetical protein
MSHMKVETSSGERTIVGVTIGGFEVTSGMEIRRVP